MENKKLQKKHIAIISVIVAIIVISVIALIILLSGNDTINLNDYLETKYVGYNESAEAKYDIDYEKIVADYAKELGLDSKDARVVFEYELEEYIDIDIENGYRLSNGDKVSFIWEVNEQFFEEKYGIELEYKDIHTKVSGLEDRAEYDPLENVTLKFQGMSSSGKAYLTSENEEYSWIEYVITPNTGLSNGDKITVSVQYEDYVDEMDLCESHGIKFTRTEREFTVEGLGDYISKLEEVPQEQLEKMQKQAEDVFKAHVASEWAETESVKGMTYLGSYLLKTKGDHDYGEANNYMYLVYKIDVTNSLGDISYYYYTRFEDIYISDEGEFAVNVLRYYTPKGSATYWWDKWTYSGEVFIEGEYYYLGYRKLDELFSYCVTNDLDDYTYESNVEDK